MVKPSLIAIMTWTPDAENGRNDAVRETWVKAWCWPTQMIVGGSGPNFIGGHSAPDYKFYYDREHDKSLLSDELKFDVPRGKYNTSFKTHAMAKWALEQGYEHVFFVPVDCYIAVPRLLVSGYQWQSYTGYQVPTELHIGGGSGYWLGPRALEAVASFDPYPDYEDRWVGAACRSRSIQGDHDARYWSWEQPWLHGIITAHLSAPETAEYDQKMMYAYHKQYLERGEIWSIPPIQSA